jgi:hypothetical protein
MIPYDVRRQWSIADRIERITNHTVLFEPAQATCPSCKRLSPFHHLWYRLKEEWWFETHSKPAPYQPCLHCCQKTNQEVLVWREIHRLTRRVFGPDLCKIVFNLYLRLPGETVGYPLRPNASFVQIIPRAFEPGYPATVLCGVIGLCFGLASGPRADWLFKRIPQHILDQAGWFGRLVVKLIMIALVDLVCGRMEMPPTYMVLAWHQPTMYATRMTTYILCRMVGVIAAAARCIIQEY